MLGAFTAWMLLTYLGVGYWGALLLAPIIVGAIGIVLERLLIRWLYHLDHLYGLLLTFGLALIITGIFKQLYGVSGIPYQSPPLLARSEEHTSELQSLMRISYAVFCLK